MCRYFFAPKLSISWGYPAMMATYIVMTYQRNLYSKLRRINFEHFHQNRSSKEELKPLKQQQQEEMKEEEEDY